MARIFITGSAGGLGRPAAQTLLGDGHEVRVGIPAVKGTGVRGTGSDSHH
jgi:nucleoside-diphosphate-sugar epimerase